MPNLIKAKIDLSKIHGAKVRRKDGRTFIEVTDSKLFEGKNGALYLDAAFFETPGHEYGDWRISQDLPQAFRGSDVKGAILGNGKNKTYGQPAAQQSSPPSSLPAPSPPPPSQEIDDSVPF